MAIDLKKFIGRFIEEAKEHLDKLGQGIMDLEKSPEDSENINSIFRSAHTIKGSSRMMNLTPITEVAHKLEDVLGSLRDKKIKPSARLSDLLLSAVDAISAMVEMVASGKEIAADNTALCESLVRAAEKGSSDMPEELTAQPKDSLVEEKKPTAAPAVEDHSNIAAPDARQKVQETFKIKADKLDDLIKLMGEIVSGQSRLRQRLGDAKEIESMAAKQLAGIEAKAAQGGLAEVAASSKSLFASIKKLVADLKDDVNIYELLTDDLQGKTVMMRMVPLSTALDSFRRMVRDMSRSIGKEVEIIIEGDNIELDKKIVEKIGDPLVHMIRNSIDHGIEKPEERINKGKPLKGNIRLSAVYDAGSVLIEIADDGAGLPLEKIKEKAVRKKIFAEEEANALRESELIDLIFHPGFSTSEIITDISGRGVGMDVVRKYIIEDMKGSIRVETQKDKGTNFFIRLPLTLAVMRLLLISSSGYIFAVSAHYVKEVIRASEDEFMTVVDKKALKLRNEFIPVVNMAELLKLPADRKKHARNNAAGMLILLTQVGDEKLGLIIDDLLDEEDMVIKSLPGHLKGIRFVSGFTVTGKNEIINVLHIPAVIEAASEVKERRTEIKTAAAAGASILVIDDSLNTREIEKSILESYGYSVTLAEDGLDGFEKAMRGKFDAVITDVEMPRLDGFSLTEKLRMEEAYKHTPIIIVTSRQKEEDKRRGISVGADAYIIKGSFERSNLIETIQNLIG
ncbi:MAG: hybrid sensor histidine kinase/response regulator [Nitrospirae bacterium]|nr:hybrid sensor histidine kinase/response regulator [Nitrospirota bacterium]